MTINDVLPKIDVSQYLGEWIVICDSKVIAHHRDLTRLQKDIDGCKKTPTITKIPTKDILIF